MPEQLNINEWAEEDRPREQLAAKGAGAARMPDIHLMDHVIVTDGHYYSYLNEKKL